MTQHTPFKLMYGREAVMTMEFLVPSLSVTLLTHMIKEGALQKRLDELLELEKDRFVARFHQGV